MFTIISNRLFKADQPLHEPALATFSTHSAAFEAASRLHNPSWRPLGGAQYMNADDVREFVRVGGAVN
jgi:hypothetical protein